MTAVLWVIHVRRRLHYFVLDRLVDKTYRSWRPS